MSLLVAGLFLVIASHLLPTMPGTRAALVSRLGEMGYKGAFSLLAIAGLVLIVVGKGQAPFVALWNPPLWGRHLTLLLMVPVFVLLVATYLPSNIRRFIRHPMVIAVKLWALAHLLANGDLASLLLFGSIGVWAVFDLISVKKRDAGAPRPKLPLYRDALVLVLGLVAYALVAKFHYPLFGVPVIG